MEIGNKVIKENKKMKYLVSPIQLGMLIQEEDKEKTEDTAEDKTNEEV